MPHRKPIITEHDQTELLQLIEDESVAVIAAHRSVDTLKRRLRSAICLPDDRVPGTVIRLGCHVMLSDVTTGNIDMFTLVDPAQADIARGKLSVLSPLGTAILGRHLGQQVRVMIPSGCRTITIEAIEHRCQPPATATGANTVASV